MISVGKQIFMVSAQKNIFFNSLDEDKRLGKLKFDEISKNLPYKLPNLTDELLLMSITYIL